MEELSTNTLKSKHVFNNLPSELFQEVVQYIQGLGWPVDGKEISQRSSPSTFSPSTLVVIYI